MFAHSLTKLNHWCIFDPISNKWYGEHYTKAQAIAIGKANQIGPFSIGQITKPKSPAELFYVTAWIEKEVHTHHDYVGEYAYSPFMPEVPELKELETEIRGVIAKWLARNNLHPTHLVINAATIEKVENY